MVHNPAAALFGGAGLQVVEAEAEAAGTLTVWAVTGDPGAAVCPDCGMRASRVHEHVLARPRDLRRGVMDTLIRDTAGQQVLAAWIGQEKLRDVLNLRTAVTGSTRASGMSAAGSPPFMTGARRTTTSLS